MENKTVSIIKSRVSCRYYTTTKVSLSKVNQVVEAGKMAPSAMNRQICNITVVRTKRIVERLRQLAIEARGKDPYYGASTLILVTGPRDDQFTNLDGACILENMFIAATALKLNSCWINSTEDVLEKNPRFRKTLGLSEDQRVVGTCVLGYAADKDQLQLKERKADFVKYI